MPLGPTVSGDQTFNILRNLKPIGRQIGFFHDTPLYDSVEDEWGRVYCFAGICWRSGARYNVLLGAREFIQPPGIIYRMLK